MGSRKAELLSQTHPLPDFQVTKTPRSPHGWNALASPPSQDRSVPRSLCVSYLSSLLNRV